MPAFVLAPLILAAVLGLSGWAKLRATHSTSSVLMLLRLPRFLTQRWVAQALPWGELVLAAVVVLAPSGILQKVAAVATALLMVTYWVVVARAMTFDPRPNCGCFGQIGDQRITGRTLTRNSVLVALSGVYLYLAFSDTAPLAMLRDRTGDRIGWVLGAAVVALMTWFITYRSTNAVAPPPAPVTAAPAQDVQEEVGEDEYIRVLIPPAIVTDADGQQHSLRELAEARPQLLVFVNCYCGTTHRALEAWPQWSDRLPAVDVRFIFSGVPVMPSNDALDTTNAWTDHRGTAWHTLGLATSPSAVLLGADGMLAGGPVGGNEEVEAFVDDIEAALGEAYEDGMPPDPSEESDIVSGRVVAETR